MGYRRLKRQIAKSPSGLNFCKASGESRNLQQTLGSFSLSALGLQFLVTRPRRIGLLAVCNDLPTKDPSTSEHRRAQEKVVRVKAKARANGRARYVPTPNCTALVWLP